jgi:hypothetical protein
MISSLYARESLGGQGFFGFIYLSIYFINKMVYYKVTDNFFTQQTKKEHQAHIYMQ